MTISSSSPSQDGDTISRSDRMQLEHEDFPAAADHSFFGHPKALPTVLGIELWERFSYYGMNALMALYLIAAANDGGLGLSVHTSSIIIAVSGALTYLTPSIWGWLADCALGTDKVLLISGFIVMIGHISLGVLYGISGLLCGMLFIGIGGGGVKVATQSLIGVLYRNDPRRESGFSLYYMSVNIGAFLGPIVIAAVHHTTNSWRLAFSFAALGIALGMCLYLLGRRKLPASVHYPCDPASPRSIKKFYLGVIFSCATIALLWNVGLLPLQYLAVYLAIFTIGCAIVIFLGILFSRKLIIPHEMRGVAVYIPIFVVSCIFWALYQQQFNVLDYLFLHRANRHIDIFGWHWIFQEEWFQSINPVWIISLSPIFSWAWLKLGDRNPPEMVKTGIGVIIIGLVFLWIATVAYQTPVWIFVGIIFMLTVSELFLSPTGMALMPVISPQAFRGRMIILNLFNAGIGTSLTGVLSGFYHPENPAPYFYTLGGATLGIGLIFMLSVPYLQNKLTSDV